MPAFPMVNDATLPALIHYLEQGEEAASRSGGAPANDKQEMTSVHGRHAASASADPAGAASYAAHCAICHGDHREGITPSFPALIGIGSRMPRPQVLQFIHQGKGRMPGFPKLQGEELSALLRYMGVPEHIAQPQPQRWRGCGAEIPLHRLPQVPRSGWLSRHISAVGHAERDRPEYRKIPLEDTLRRISRVSRTRA